MRSEKIILGPLVVLIILASTLYLKEESTYSLVRDQAKTESSQGQKSENSDGRSLEDITVDKKIARQKAKNRKDWLGEGWAGPAKRGGDIVLGPIDSRRTEGSFADLNQAIENYIESKPDVYPPREDGHENDRNVDLVFMQTVDYRIIDLIGSIPLDKRKSPIQGLRNEKLFTYEARWLDGRYDELILAKPQGQKEWRVVFAGSYYDLKKALQ